MRQWQVKTWVTAYAAAGLMALVGAPAVTSAQQSSSAGAKDAAQGSAQDELIFRNGNTLKGTIVSETEKVIKFKSTAGGIAFETEYQKSEILSVRRATKPAAEKDKREPAKDGGAKADPVAAATAALRAGKEGATDGQAIPADARKYYYIKLAGTFGAQITQTPMKDAIDDAYANGAEVIIVEVDATWENKDGDISQGKRQVEQDFDIFRSVPINDVFLKHIPSVYGENRPKLVFWVKNAMGGSCFMPMVSRERYFAPEGKMGGIGNLSYMHGGGSERVLEKWRGASLQTAQGFANWGGIPETVVRAMARVEHVLSVRYVDGQPQYFEDYPKNPGEELLTDNGKEAEADTLEQLARFEGNDVFTLTAQWAEKLQLSRGTVATREELLDALDLTRSGVAVDRRSETIFRNWNDGLDRAQTQMVRLLRDFQEVEVTGTWEERRAARGRQMRLLDEIINLIRRFGEGMLPEWCGQHGIPYGDGAPNVQVYLNRKDQIKTEQQLDRR